MQFIIKISLLNFKIFWQLILLKNSLMILLNSFVLYQKNHSLSCSCWNKVWIKVRALKVWLLIEFLTLYIFIHLKRDWVSLISSQRWIRIWLKFISILIWWVISLYIFIIIINFLIVEWISARITSWLCSEFHMTVTYQYFSSSILMIMLKKHSMNLEES